MSDLDLVFRALSKILFVAMLLDNIALCVSHVWRIERINYLKELDKNS